MDSPAPVPPLRSSSNSDLGLPRHYKMALLIGGGLVFVLILVVAIVKGGGTKPQQANGKTPGQTPGTLVLGQTPQPTDGGLPTMGPGATGGPGGAAVTLGQDRALDGGALGARTGGDTPNPLAGNGTPVAGGTTVNGGTVAGAGTAAGGMGAGTTHEAYPPRESQVGAGTSTTGTNTASGHTTSYKVQRDDTLWLIARKTLGDGRAWPAIAKANPGVNPNRLAPGTVLKIPDAAAARTALSTPGSSGTTRSGSTGSGASRTGTSGKSVTVREGETLYAIARREYGDGEKWDVIYNANKARISNPHEIPAGVKLVIPAS